MGRDYTYDEIVEQEKEGSLYVISNKYNYGIYKCDDGKIYNVDHKRKTIAYVRNPGETKFALGDIVLVIPLEEYGEIVEVKKDDEWGNHEYDVTCFNRQATSYRWYDENEIQIVT